MRNRRNKYNDAYNLVFIPENAKLMEFQKQKQKLMVEQGKAEQSEPVKIGPLMEISRLMAQCGTSRTLSATVIMELRLKLKDLKRET